MIMNILVVDDERIQLESLKLGLNSKGYQVAVALNAEVAFEHLDKGNKIDLVITDYAMPGMNGMELLKNIREKHGDLPVIMMTAYGEKRLAIDALHNRCHSFIEKPFTLDQLTHEIERTKIHIIRNTPAYQLSELIPEFVHQINNPLMAIYGSAELAMLKMNDVEAREYMTCIMRATEKIRTINKELLGLGRPANVEIEKVDIKLLLDNCLGMFKDLLLLKGISMEKDLGGSDLCLLGNKFGLEQLFKNLILNAIDSMDGRPEKYLRIKAAADEKTSSVSIHVEDTGRGIPAQSINKIFMPYFTSKKHGTGLGLRVAERIVRKHKGKIRVRSEVDKGTTFTVTFPINRGS
jgi:two-component system NtrC family sensor kinase